MGDLKLFLFSMLVLMIVLSIFYIIYEPKDKDNE